MKATRIPFSGQWLDAPGVAHTPTKLDRFADLAGVPESVARHGDEWVRHWLGRRVSLGGDDGESMADVRTFARDKLAWLRDRHKGRRKPCP